jgi:transposase
MTKTQVEVITSVERRRRWSRAEKERIVAAAIEPGSSVSMVARHYDVNANQVFSWRRLYRDDPRVPAVPSTPQLIPVMVTAEQDAVTTQVSTVAAARDVAYRYGNRLFLSDQHDQFLAPGDAGNRPSWKSRRKI